MASSRQYLEANREILNEKRRIRYGSEDRKKEYQENREEILKKKKEDRLACPICNLKYRRLYIKQHIKTRHEKSENIV